MTDTTPAAVESAAFVPQTDPSILAAEHSKFRWRDMFANGFFRFFALATLLPTLIAGVYYGLFAADQFVSDTSFSIYAEEKSIDMNNLGVAYGLMDTQTKKDLLIVKDYIESPSLLTALDGRVGLKEIYRHKDADFWARLPDDATEEDFIDYYRDMIKMTMNQDAGTIDLQVNAFAAEDAKAIAANILDITEAFINDMMTRIRSEDLAFAGKQLKDAENQVIGAMDDINRFRKVNNNLDPEKTGSGLFALIQELEAEKIKMTAELSALSKSLRDNAYELKQMKHKIAALEGEIEKQRQKLVGSEAEPLSDVMQEYGRLLMQQDFAVKRYEIALTSYETALVTAHRKSKYIVRIIEPKAPELSTRPKRAKKTFTVFVISLMGASITLLFVAGVRDHINV